MGPSGYYTCMTPTVKYQVVCITRWPQKESNPSQIYCLHQELHLPHIWVRNSLLVWDSCIGGGSSYRDHVLLIFQWGSVPLKFWDIEKIDQNDHWQCTNLIDEFWGYHPPQPKFFPFLTPVNCHASVASGWLDRTCTVMWIPQKRERESFILIRVLLNRINVK